MDGTVYTDIKGRKAEERFREIACTLKKCFPDIKVKRTKWVLDRQGVDFVITLYNPANRMVTIPIQVKSSDHQAMQFWKKYPHYKHHNVILVVVNNQRISNEIFDELQAKLLHVLEAGICYKKFFQLLEHVPKGDLRRREVVQRKKEEKRMKDRWRRHTLPLDLQSN